MRKIAVITGTRADYGIYKSVLSSIEAVPELRLSLLVVGMHLAPEFGYTLKEIENDGFKISARISLLHNEDTKEAMAESIGLSIVEISKQLALIKPDILLVLGDRGEMLAGAVSATYLGIPIAHIHGGDISGNVDEPVRHAITKLSHIHLAATAQSAERIMKLGEEPWRVHVVGAPGLDMVRNGAHPEPAEFAKKFGLDLSKPLIMVVQHSVVSESDSAEDQIIETLEAITELKTQTVLIYPNADAGGRKMIAAIKRYERYSFIKTFQSLPHDAYLALMKIASVMVGNSSSGIIEAPSFNLPVVNIGTRQMGRQREKNVTDVGYSKEEILTAAKKALTCPITRNISQFGKSVYGDGNAGQRIAKILSEIEINDRLMVKRMMY